MRHSNRTIVFLATFILSLPFPAQAGWDRFQIIEWQKRTPAELATLRRLGVTATAATADRDGTGIPLDRQTQAPRDAGLTWYIENIATDFYASYHRFTAGKIENWRFLETQKQYRANPDDETALRRNPELADPGWRQRIGRRIANVVKAQQRFHPLYYTLADEPGIADLSAFWDFDLSPRSVAGFRIWLHGQYSTLGALNREWGTAYAGWDAVQPETTRAAMRRGDDNFAAWNDFKAWMDTSFADAVRFGTDTIHRADPTALSAIEGAQTLGWGGYDYSKLAHTVDVMEIYNDGLNLPVLRSLNPRVIPLTTSFAATPEALHATWRAILLGARGIVLWDEDNRIAGPDARDAASYAPMFALLRGEIGRRLAGAEPVHDPVAILYSPVSQRVQWMLDRRPDGDAWMQRSAGIELRDNAWRVALRDAIAEAMRHGLRPRFITPAQLAAGPPSAKILILPQAIALSAREVRSIAAFAARGGQVIANVAAGAFDEHGKRRAAPLVEASDGPLRDIPPKFRVNGADTFLFRSNGAFLLALQRKAPGTGADTVTIATNAAAARDLATGRVYRSGQSLTLDPVTPLFLEIRR